LKPITELGTFEADQFQPVIDFKNVIHYRSHKKAVTSNPCGVDDSSVQISTYLFLSLVA
jgi:hypothetical protein